MQGLNAYAASKKNSIGDTLYVWANDGLLMRKEPKFESPSLMKLDYGTAIVVMERTGVGAEFVVARAMKHNQRSLPGISIFGGFVKIHYKGMEGFIFDGFLSRLAPLHDQESLDDYFGRVFGQLQTIDRSKPDSEYRFKRIFYKTGIVSEFEGGPENWFTHLYFIPGISLKEAYLLINKATGFERNYKRQISEGSTYFDQRPEKFAPDEIVIGYELGQQTIRVDHGHVFILSEFGN
ncbi:SH3 domain-containing protein [Chryseolinea soli]|uniref:SH3 domain-containing protein n=2 Tax=Chryseolinea soli TaxID=2321403 RepID=A0A385STJ2_9BACT|nr:SH3 domain-containing protein [Chryseolinea soli]